MSRILSKDLKIHVGKVIVLKGWLHNLRTHGDMSFLILRDRSGLAQAVVSKDDVEPLKGLQLGTVISLCGKVIKAPPAPGGYELHDVEIGVITPISEPLPLPIYKTMMKVFATVYPLSLTKMKKRF
jgi:nondiscriminating aspartyl-tRNA synthetase